MGRTSEMLKMRSLAILLFSFSSLARADKVSPLFLIDENTLNITEAGEFNSTGLKECESEAGRRCVHFTECDGDGLIVEEDTMGDNLMDVRFGSSDGLHCPGEMDICCRERERETTCPPDFEPWKNKCYHFSPSVDLSRHSVVYLTWSDAKAACQNLNESSTLPVVESREENSFVNNKTHNTIFWLGAYRKYAASYTDQECPAGCQSEQTYYHYRRAGGGMTGGG